MKNKMTVKLLKEIIRDIGNIEIRLLDPLTGNFFKITKAEFVGMLRRDFPRGSDNIDISKYVEISAGGNPRIIYWGDYKKSLKTGPLIKG